MALLLTHDILDSLLLPLQRPHMTLSTAGEDSLADQRKAHLTLPHRNTRTIPEALLGLHLLVIIMPAGAQGSSKLILVLCQSLRKQRKPLLQ